MPKIDQLRNIKIKSERIQKETVSTDEIHNLKYNISEFNHNFLQNIKLEK